MIRFLPLLLLAAPAFAEGNVQSFSCQPVTGCQADATCGPVIQRPLTFTLTPEEIDAQGAGTVTITYGGQSAEAQILTSHGPIFWVLEGQENTLIASSATKMIWHILDLSAGQSEVLFLDCGDRG